jgi:hypothetical protein
MIHGTKVPVNAERRMSFDTGEFSGFFLALAEATFSQRIVLCFSFKNSRWKQVARPPSDFITELLLVSSVANHGASFPVVLPTLIPHLENVFVGSLWWLVKPPCPASTYTYQQPALTGLRHSLCGLRNELRAQIHRLCCAQ